MFPSTIITMGPVVTIISIKLTYCITLKITLCCQNTVGDTSVVLYSSKVSIFLKFRDVHNNIEVFSSCFYFITPKIYLLRDYAGSACTLNKNENTKSGTVC